MLIVMANEKKDSHIEKMYYRQNAHYFAGHCTDTCYYFRPGRNCFPKPDGDGNIAQVQQVVTH